MTAADPDPSGRLSRADRVRRSVEASRNSRIPTWGYALMLVAMIAAVLLVIYKFG